MAALVIRRSLLGLTATSSSSVPLAGRAICRFSSSSNGNNSSKGDDDAGSPSKLATRSNFSNVGQNRPEFAPDRDVNYQRPNPAHRYRWTWTEQDEIDNPLPGDTKVPLSNWMVDESIPERRRPTAIRVPLAEFDKDTGSWRNPLRQGKWVNINFVTSQGERATIRALAGVDTLVSAAMRNKIYHMWDMCESNMECEYCTCFVPNDMAEARPMTVPELEVYTSVEVHRANANSRMGCQITVTEDMEGKTFGLPPYKDKSFFPGLMVQGRAAQDTVEKWVKSIQLPELRFGTTADMADLYEDRSRSFFKKVPYPGPEVPPGKPVQLDSDKPDRR